MQMVSREPFRILPEVQDLRAREISGTGSNVEWQAQGVWQLLPEGMRWQDIEDRRLGVT